jgi:hypothetical protein
MHFSPLIETLVVYCAVRSTGTQADLCANVMPPDATEQLLDFYDQTATAAQPAPNPSHPDSKQPAAVPNSTVQNSSKTGQAPSNSGASNHHHPSHADASKVRGRARHSVWLSLHLHMPGACALRVCFFMTGQGLCLVAVVESFFHYFRARVMVVQALCAMQSYSVIRPVCGLDRIACHFMWIGNFYTRANSTFIGCNHFIAC